MPSRRTFLTGTIAVLTAPHAPSAWPQDKAGGRVFRLGMLDMEPAAANAANLVQFQKGLKELGYTEGRNLTTDYRAESRSERLPELAAKLVRAKVDVIVTRGTPATVAAKNAPDNIPVVAAGIADPVDTKVVERLERPGGKVTGLAFLVKEVEQKRIDLLRALAPGRKRVVALIDMGNPALAQTWKLTEEAARAAGLQAELVDVRRVEDVQKAFDTATTKHRAEALIVRLGGIADAPRRAVVDLAARHKLPAIYASRQFVDAGGLVSYGVSAPFLYYRAAFFVDKIFKGANPAELPMERPSKFELIVNRKALRDLGLTLPPDLLLRSDEIV